MISRLNLENLRSDCGFCAPPTGSKWQVQKDSEFILVQRKFLNDVLGELEDARETASVIRRFLDPKNPGTGS